MNKNDRLYIGDYVTFENPNFRKQEICKVFLIQMEANGEIKSASLERLNHCIENRDIEKFSTIGPNDPYIFPANPVIIELINPISISSININRLSEKLKEKNLILVLNDFGNWDLKKNDTNYAVTINIKFLHELQQELRQLSSENDHIITDLLKFS